MIFAQLIWASKILIEKRNSFSAHRKIPSVSLSDENPPKKQIFIPKLNTQR